MPENASPARRWLRHARCAAAAALATMLLSAAGAQAAVAYQNPFSGSQPSIGRTDMGVDACLNPGDPIRAVGNGIVVGVDRNWFQGQPYLWYELNSGPNAWHFVYVAEQIHDLARPGQVIHAGDVIARYAKKGTCIEMGWGTAAGQTLAQATTGYHEGQVTQAGVSFARFLMGLGVQGSFELASPAAQAKATKKRSRKARRHLKARRATDQVLARRAADQPAARR